VELTVLTHMPVAVLKRVLLRDGGGRGGKKDEGR